MAEQKEDSEFFWDAMDITKDNRAFVARGGEIDLYNGEEVVKAFQSPMKVSKIQLADQSRRMLTLTPTKEQRHTIFLNDTETGKPLHKFQCKLLSDLNSPVKTFSPKKKFQNLEAADTIGLTIASGNRVCDLALDPRVKDEELMITEDSSSIIKSRGHQFTAVATTSDGGIAAADNNGVVRLYSDLGKRAKTQLDQYSGVPILGLDTSSDGNWVLWTTEKHLCLSKVGFKTDKGVQTTGFKSVMGKDKGHTLIIKLLKEDLEHMGITEDDVHLTPARFDNGPAGDTTGNVTEERIVTSTGAFTVSWKFRQLKVDYKNSKTSNTNYTKSSARIEKQPEKVLRSLFEYDTNYTAVNALSSKLTRLNI